DQGLVSPEERVAGGDLAVDVPEREEAPVALDHRAAQRVGIVGRALAPALDQLRPVQRDAVHDPLDRLLERRLELLAGEDALDLAVGAPDGDEGELALDPAELEALAVLVLGARVDVPAVLAADALDHSVDPLLRG